MPNTSWLAGQRITASGLNDLIPLSTQLYVASQSISSHASNYTAVSFTDVLSSNDSDMWSVSNPTRLVAPHAGTYQLHGILTWPSGLSSSDGRGEFRVSGSGTAITSAKVSTVRGSSGNCIGAVSGVVVFTADSQYVEMYVNQNSGGSLNITCSLGMSRVSFATS